MAMQPVGSSTPARYGKFKTLCTGRQGPALLGMHDVRALFSHRDNNDTGSCCTYHSVFWKHALLQPKVDRVHVLGKTSEQDGTLGMVGQVNFTDREE